jgi:Zn finger protein HypA/HybF involved in hydrogenase expression
MHEHSMADEVVRCVDRLREEAGAGTVKRVMIRVSELSGLTESALQMMIDHAAEEMDVEPFRVDIISDGLLGYCPRCGISPITEELICAACGAEGVRPAGDEAFLVVACEFE